VRDAEGTALIAVAEIEPELVAVGQQLDHVADASSAKDHHDLRDAHLPQGLEREVDHRSVVHR
jgi:hypothetical protein